MIHTVENIALWLNALTSNAINVEYSTGTQNSYFIEFYETRHVLHKVETIFDKRLVCISSAGFINVRGDITKQVLKFFDLDIDKISYVKTEELISTTFQFSKRCVIELIDPKDRLEFQMMYFS